LQVSLFSLPTIPLGSLLLWRGVGGGFRVIWLSVRKLRFFRNLEW